MTKCYLNYKLIIILSFIILKTYFVHNNNLKLDILLAKIKVQMNKKNLYLY